MLAADGKREQCCFPVQEIHSQAYMVREREQREEGGVEQDARRGNRLSVKRHRGLPRIQIKTSVINKSHISRIVAFLF